MDKEKSCQVCADEDFERRFKRTVCIQLCVEDEMVTHDRRFISDLGADSLDVVELVMELEKEFNITIPPIGETSKTVGELHDITYQQYNNMK